MWVFTLGSWHSTAELRPRTFSLLPTNNIKLGQIRFVKGNIHRDLRKILKILNP